MKVNLWLDDERNPKLEYVQSAFGSSGNEIWVKTAQEAWGYFVNPNFIVESISFDHDLGQRELTGYELARSIELNCHMIPRFKWFVHSQNPVGVRNIQAAMQQCDKIWNTRGIYG